MIRKSLLIIAALTCASLAVNQTVFAQDRRPSDVLERGTLATVTRVIDGDTIEVSQNGRTFPVTYIGINAPALNECLGAQANQANNALVAGKTVIIEKDATDVNDAGASPRYVYLPDARMVNEELLKSGMAVAVTQLPDTKYQAGLNALASTAQAAKKGGWARCGWKPPASNAAMINGCIALDMADLASRKEALPQFGLLNAGDCVTIVKQADEESDAWSGQFIWHPKGSTVTLTPGYVRWKDGFVMLDRSADDASQLNAHLDYYRNAPPSTVTFGGQVFTIPSRKKVHYQAVLPLERDPGDNSTIRLPDVKTWLFKDLGNGQVKTLVDYFEYKAGDMKLPPLLD
jgi:endonuclease YncB( thermonuclease family)